MGYMKEEKIIVFLNDLKKNLINYEEQYGDEFEIYFDDSLVRYGSKIANLETMLYDCEKAEDAFYTADCSLAEFYDDPYLDVYISCEGSVYEDVYGYSAYGGDDHKKDLYDAFDDAAEANGLTMDFCDGALAFQSDESWEKQIEDNLIERKRIEEELRRKMEEI